MPEHLDAHSSDASRWSRLAAEQLPGRQWTTDRQLHVTSFGGAGWATPQVRTTPLLGQPVAAVFAIERTALAAHQRALEGERASFEYRDENVILQAVVEPLHDANQRIVGCVGVALDITSQKRNEDALRAAHHELLGERHNLGRNLFVATTKLSNENAHRNRIEDELREEQQFLRRLLDLQEQERKLLAYDIHDGFVQDVVGAKMILEGVLHKSASEPAREDIELARQHLGDAIDEGRRLIGGLRPMIIDEEGVIAAIDFLVEDERLKSGIALSFVHHVQFDRLMPLLESTVYRIVQEALTNIKRHSQTDRAEIRLTQRGNRLAIEIKDFGVGFDVECVPRNRFGLEGIRERARLFGGRATIESVPGESTTIRVKLPIAPRATPELNFSDRAG